MNDWNQQEPNRDLFVVRTRRLFRGFLIGVVGLTAIVWSGLHWGWFQRPGSQREEIDLRYLAPFETSDWFTIIPSDRSDGKKLVLQVRKTHGGNTPYSPFVSEDKTFSDKDIESINETQLPGRYLIDPLDSAKKRNVSVGIRRFNREYLGGATRNDAEQLFIEMKRDKYHCSRELSSNGFFQGKIRGWGVNHSSEWIKDQLNLMTIDTMDSGEVYHYEFIVVQRKVLSYD